MTRDEMYQIVATELGYKSYNGEWGRQHLVDGGHGDCYFSDTTGTMFERLVTARLKLDCAESNLKRQLALRVKSLPSYGLLPNNDCMISRSAILEMLEK